MNKNHFTKLFLLVMLLVLITFPTGLVDGNSLIRIDDNNSLGGGLFLSENDKTHDFSSKNISDEEDNAFSELSFLDTEPPYLSDDGKTLINAAPPRILVVDPNPEMQNLRFPREAWVDQAVTDDDRSTGATFSIAFRTSGTDIWGLACSAFPTEAKAAFNAAASIWANTINSTVPITISACWSSSLPSGVLGISGGGYWIRNFPGAPKSNTYYQTSLANSFAGYDLASDRADMYITYSSSFNWYYGTDGNTPSGFYDLVSVAAHEIAHGLHFAGIMEYSDGSAEYGFSGYPSVFETFVESIGGTNVTTYPNPSTALGTLVTSNNLYWDGPNANAANGGQRVRMYAPASWSNGSSYSHLDYSTYAGTINSLMVYAIGSGSSQHNPGPITLGILEDMGWVIGETSVEPPTVPTGISATDGLFTDKVFISWNMASGANSYKVFRNTNNNHNNEMLLTSSQTTTTFIDDEVVQDQTYYYWVQACIDEACSDYSPSDSGYAASVVDINQVFIPLVRK